jgi:glutaredoxin
MSSVNASSPSRSSRERKIIVYTTTSCHKCAALKDWLKTFKGNFEERNLENVDVMAELVMRNLVVLSAPVLEVDDAVYVEAEFFDGNTLAVDKLREIFGE